MDRQLGNEQEAPNSPVARLHVRLGGFLCILLRGDHLRFTVLCRVKLEIDQCPLISMTYTLPQSLRSLSKFGENITFPAAYGGDADDLTSTARDAVLGFSRTREVLGGVMKFGSSLRSALAPSNLSQVQCKYRYETSAHALGLQQFRLQLFECLPAEPDIDTGLRAGQKRKEWAEERSGMDSHARAMPSHRSLLSNEPVSEALHD
jgi:hypothetical protein